jgi:hypothetical protein
MPAVPRVSYGILLGLASFTVASAQSSGTQLAVNRGGVPLAMESMHASHVYVDEDPRAAPESVSAPRNLVTSPELQQLVMALLRASPTFRRQCARLESAPSLTVTVKRTIPAGEGTRASTTIINAPEKRLYATVHLGPAADESELLAHELEHIIEQLDGVDLAAMAKRSGTGVWNINDAGYFETERAKAVGRQVADELRRFGE